MTKRGFVTGLMIWCVLTAGLGIQGWFGLDEQQGILRAECEKQAQDAAGKLALETRLARAEAGSTMDELIARPVVLDFLEAHKELSAAAVFAGGRLLEAQERRDGVLKPLGPEPGDAVVQARVPLQEGSEDWTWVAMDMAPWNEFDDVMVSAALTRALSLIFGCGVLMLGIGLWRAKRPRQ